MKKIAQTLVAVALLANFATAFAQSTAPEVQGNAVVAAQPSGAAVSGNWASGDALGQTGSQVHQELLHAKQDGQIDYLNHTLYAHH